ncbi:class I SAM-dependent methyltransferase [Caldanaerobius polysaccharolyticus]|nr:hypothetical protein [Caldanaerobius polysaccharolyticus]
MSDNTEIIKKRYDRAARYYDVLEGFMEKRWIASWRKELFSHVKGFKILEVGVGTGKNIPYYPEGCD